MKISAKKYAKALHELTKDKENGEIDSIVLNFAKELKKKRKINSLNDIVANFSDIYNEANGIVECEIVCAREIGTNQIDEIKDFIKNKYNAKEVIDSVSIDESIKGGIILKIGDEIIDGSVLKKLKNLNILLKK